MYETYVDVLGDRNRVRTRMTEHAKSWIGGMLVGAMVITLWSWFMYEVAQQAS